MEAVAEGLWGLADDEEKRGEIGKAVKCLEALCQSQVSFLPIVEVKTRLRIATLLLKHTHNLTEAKSHLERSQLLLKTIPSCFELKCTTYSLLSQCYHLVGAIPPQKQILHKALDLTASTFPEVSVSLWSCNFNSQLANALIIEGDYHSAVSSLEDGYTIAKQINYPELQMFFATSVLHVQLMQWCDDNLVQSAMDRCDQLWDSISPDKREECTGLLFYNELLHIFYQLRKCDYKNATQHVDKLDVAMKADLQKMREIQRLNNELNALNQSLSRPDLPSQDRSLLSLKLSQIQQQITNKNKSTSFPEQSLEAAYFGNSRRSQDKLVLAPPPIDGEWLPKSAVYALVDLMMVIFARPRGLFKDCARRIQSGMQTIQGELVKLGITDGVKEVDLQHSAIWMAGVYLMLLMQFLENKVAVELTRSEFVDAQEALVQMKYWFLRFPTILQACESVIEMLRGQYAHSVGCYSEAAFHFVEGANLTENKSMKAMCQIYAAISYFCIGDAESSSQALDLIGPIYRMKDSFVGVREQSSVLFAYGLLLMRQDEYEESRARLAKGLQIAHNSMANLQLIAQYLTILGHLALALHDTTQAREILRSALTLAKKLNDIPTQIWVISVLTDLYQALGEVGNQMENEDFRKKKSDELQKKLLDAQSSIHHIELIAKVRFEVKQLQEIDTKRATANHTTVVNLDIPESVGLSNPLPNSSSSRLLDLDNRKRRKRRI
ncbi:sister chromatid cohesion protein SCC4 [Euphorbia lathyris]|uniref:sister chromatid cohesion protein SCC4 n=1 Tax=Euphorbia lathyris TaxID=212925 RepID=UPI0033132A6B